MVARYLVAAGSGPVAYIAGKNGINFVADAANKYVMPHISNSETLSKLSSSASGPEMVTAGVIAMAVGGAILLYNAAKGAKRG